MSDTTTAQHDAWVPTGRPRLIDPHTLVFWVSAVAVVFSAIHLYSYITDNPLLIAGVAWLALVQWTLYGLVLLLIVYRHQLFVRRPVSITIGALVWGGTVAVYLASQANQALESIFTQVFSPEWNQQWGLAISAATNEEPLKLLGVIVLVLMPLTCVRTTLDGLFYGMMVGLGFQVVEDYMYTVGQAFTLGDAVGFLLTRGVVAGLFAHAVYTGITGAGLGYLISRRDKSMGMRILVAVAAFAFAWCMHVFWDSPVLTDWGEESTGAFFAVIFVKGAPALLILLLALRWGREHERPEWSEFVDANVDPALVTAEDRVSLLDHAGRKAARKESHKWGGHKAAHARKTLQTVQLEYVQAVREEGADSERAGDLASDIEELQAIAAPPLAAADPDPDPVPA